MPYSKDHDRFARLFRPRSGETLTTAAIKEIVQRDSPELQQGSPFRKGPVRSIQSAVKCLINGRTCKTSRTGNSGLECCSLMGHIRQH